MKSKLISFVTILFIILASSRSIESKDNRAGAVILTSAGGIALGTGVFFLIRNIIRNRQYGDSIISEVEALWDSSEAAFRSENFTGCIHFLNRIQPMRGDYIKYVSKRDKGKRFDIDTLESFLISCRLLENLSNSIKRVNEFCETFPKDEYELNKMDRNDLLRKLQLHKSIIDSIENVYRLQRETVRYGFRASLKKMEKFDLLLKNTYDQAKLDFSLKCKFYYNRAYKSKDTSKLRKFVQNCDYYQVDKKWCIQARSILDPEFAQKSGIEVSDLKKLSPIDSMRLQYDVAIKSGRIDLLEKYISRYSKRPFKRSQSKVGKARIVLDSLQRELKAQTHWNKSHPLFANSDTFEFSIVIKGVKGKTENIFKTEFYSLINEFKTIKGIRFPAGLVIDYSASPSIILFKGYFDCKNDVSRTVKNGTYCYAVSGVDKTMELLNRYKNKVARTLSEDSRISLQEIVSIKSAAYIVRLRKNNNEYITFYGKENTKEKGSVEYYNFYDIKLSGLNDIRYQNEPSSMIKVSADKTDSCQTCKFFEYKK